MTETDINLISRIGDGLITPQNKKLDKIAEQLEVQTRLQEGILRQIYLLCQIAATPYDHVKANLANSSADDMRAVRMGEHTVRMEEQP